MRRGTTPTYTVTIPGYDLTQTTVYITIKQLGYVPLHMLTLSNDDVSISSDASGSVITFQLSQKQTLMFAPGQAQIQIRFIDSEGTAYGTDEGTIEIKPILLEGVIEYG